MSSSAAPRPASPSAGRQVHLAFVALFLLALFVQVYLAGRGIFGESSINAHKDVGNILHLVSLVLLIVTVAMPATRNRQDIGMAAVLFVLLTIQVIIGDRDHPAVAAFHPVLALVIIGLVFGMVKRDRTAPA